MNGQTHKILVADDDLPILEVIKIVLEDKGFEVVTVSDGKLVQQAVEEHSPTLVLLDIWMSGHDGRDVAQQLRRNRATERIPIIVISAHNDVEKLANEAGADGFLVKPFDIDTLSALVERYL